MVFWKKRFFEWMPDPMESGDQKKEVGRGPGGRPACLAPFRCMYFGPRGEVYACCYNRGRVLGIYPRDDLRAIWSGKAVRELRESLEKGLFPGACSYCGGIMAGADRNASKAGMYDSTPENRNGYPAVMEFELDSTCNYECIMCTGKSSSAIRRNRLKRDLIPSPYDRAFVKRLEEFIPHLHEARFYGGEPFLVEIYYSIWEALKNARPDLSISVQTNGSVWTDRLEALLGRRRFSVSVSLDAARRETYEAIRKNGRFENVMRNIHRFRDACRRQGTFFGLSAVAIRQNWRELHEVVLLANDLDVPVTFQTVWSPAHCALWNLEAFELERMISAMQAHEFGENTEVERHNLEQYRALIRRLGSWRDAARQRGPFPASLSSGLESVRNILGALQARLSDAETKRPEFQDRMRAFEAALASLPGEEARRTAQRNIWLYLEAFGPGFVIEHLLGRDMDTLMEALGPPPVETGKSVQP
ncbi:MAG: radical SAM protein [Deltaproteobacteria bacterium]|nr:radical SAM protein [Deltaproteobacteria bacterium]